MIKFILKNLPLIVMTASMVAMFWTIYKGWILSDQEIDDELWNRNNQKK